MITLPTLYKKTSTGATQMWSIGVDANNIIVNFGQVDGKIQRTEEVIKNGKNVGRSNETTPEEQALAEATAKWEGKIKKGYVEELSRASNGESNIEGGFQPMLAHKFADQGHKIKYPAYTQPKLNGHRCLATVKDGVAKLFSRTRKPITSCPHIIKELQEMFPAGEYQLDGELYNHTYKDNFEELASLIRQETPADNCTEVEYYMYDVNLTVHFAMRQYVLEQSFLNKTPKYLKNTQTILVKDEEDMMEAFNKFLAAGYEGGMARNNAAGYEGKRSYNLQKIKEFQDADYPIVGIKEGRGGYSGCGIFICKTPEGKEFDVKMRGPKERLMDFFNDHSLWQGKTLVVKYQYISKYGIPIFPVGERFKDEI